MGSHEDVSLLRELVDRGKVGISAILVNLVEPDHIVAIELEVLELVVLTVFSRELAVEVSLDIASLGNAIDSCWAGQGRLLSSDIPIVG